jgi:hypothetical protein
VHGKTGTVMLRMNVTVQTQVLPPPSEWRFRLDLWQNPWVIAWYYNLRPWSDEHKALLKQHLKLYADAGGKFITTYAVHSPWQDNSYMIEGGMIDWIKRKDGSWRFDYRIFDNASRWRSKRASIRPSRSTRLCRGRIGSSTWTSAPATSSRSRGHPIPTNSRAPGTRFSMT